MGQAERQFTEQVQALLDAANGAVDDVIAKRARILLLFDSKSEAVATSKAIEFAGGHLRLQDVPPIAGSLESALS